MSDNHEFTDNHNAPQRSEFETSGELMEKIKQRIVVLGQNEDREAFAFHYHPKAYETFFSITNQETGQEELEAASLSDFINADPRDLHDWARVSEEIESDIASRFMETLPDFWWQNLELLNVNFGQDFFEKNRPVEQLIVGQGDASIRFFNYADTPMTPEKTDDCRKFVDLITQYFGDKMYEYVTDVVVAPINHDVKGQENIRGFVKSALDGVIFIDSALLTDEDDPNDYDDIQESLFLQVLTHEFGHLLHGDGDDNMRKLLEFAEAIGWNVEGLRANAPFWQFGWGGPIQDFAPIYGVAIKNDDGSVQKMSYEQYLFDRQYDDEGNVINKEKPYYIVGSPSDYGETSPKESYAETTAGALLGEYVVNHMPETRDAWLDHAGERGPLAAPLDRRPVTVGRHTGNGIIYPQTELPEMVYVRAIPDIQ